MKKQKNAPQILPREEWPYEVPENWVWTRLSTLLSEIKNGTTIKQDKSGNGFFITRIESLQRQTIDFSRLGTIVDSNAIKENDWYKINDIALSHINSAEQVGKTAIITETMLPLVHGMNLLRLRFVSQLAPHYFYYYSQSFQYRDAVLQRINMAVNQVSINQKQIGSIELPLPPLPEQQRIIARIESLFAKLDAAAEKLRRICVGNDVRISQCVGEIDLVKKSILARAFRGLLGTNDPKEESAERWLKEKNSQSKT